MFNLEFLMVHNCISAATSLDANLVYFFFDTTNLVYYYTTDEEQSCPRRRQTKSKIKASPTVFPKTHSLNYYLESYF